MKSFKLFGCLLLIIAVYNRDTEILILGSLLINNVMILEKLEEIGNEQ